jgi:hypothetical protein
MDARHARLRAANAHVDQQLVVRAAWEAPRMAPPALERPGEPRRSHLFRTALQALRSTLSVEAHAALRGRYDADRPGFSARLAALGA